MTTGLADARAALDAVPGWRGTGAAIEELPGGLTNRVYRVRRGAEVFLLRLDAAHTAAFGLDRTTEAGVHAAAARAGLAPPLLYADAERGILLRRYLPGRVWTAADLVQPAGADALARLLRRVHALPSAGRVLDPAAAADRYLGGLAGDARFADRAAAIARWLADAGPPAGPRCCHNDVVAGNLVATPGLVLIDWEYASDNDPLFDLASAIAFHELDAAVADRLLGAYRGEAGPASRDALARQLTLYRALAWLWYANRERRTPDPDQRDRLARLWDALRPLLPR